MPPHAVLQEKPNHMSPSPSAFDSSQGRLDPESPRFGLEAPAGRKGTEDFRCPLPVCPQVRELRRCRARTAEPTSLQDCQSFIALTAPVIPPSLYLRACEANACMNSRVLSAPANLVWLLHPVYLVAGITEVRGVTHVNTDGLPESQSLLPSAVLRLPCCMDLRQATHFPYPREDRPQGTSGEKYRGGQNPYSNLSAQGSILPGMEEQGATGVGGHLKHRLIQLVLPPPSPQKTRGVI